MTTKKKTAPPAVVKNVVAKLEPAPEPPSPAKLQLVVFDEAVQLFLKQRFAEARVRFLKAMEGPALHVRDKARSYGQVCDRKCAPRDLHLRTAEDFFNYGVERLNARDIQIAREQFTRAINLEPTADYAWYSLSIACGIDGDGDAAYENLKRAIELEPRNRILARQDPEFASLAQQFPQLRALLRPPEQNFPF